MQKTSDKKMPFLIKVALLFVLLALGYYKNQHTALERKIYSQKIRNTVENPLPLAVELPPAEGYQIIKIEIKN